MKVINPLFFAQDVVLSGKMKMPSELCCQITCWVLNFAIAAAYLSVSVQFSAYSLAPHSVGLLLLLRSFCTIRNQEQMCKQNTIISSNMRTNESKFG